MNRILGAACAVVLTVGLAACGDDERDAAEAAPGAASGATDVPPCDEVEMIDDEFEGCEEDGQVQAAVIYDCKDGSELVAAGSVWGKRGEEARHVPDAADSPEYAAAWDKCKGF